MDEGGFELWSIIPRRPLLVSSTSTTSAALTSATEADVRSIVAQTKIEVPEPILTEVPTEILEDIEEAQRMRRISAHTAIVIRIHVPVVVKVVIIVSVDGLVLRDARGEPNPPESVARIAQREDRSAQPSPTSSCTGFCSDGSDARVSAARTRGVVDDL